MMDVIWPCRAVDQDVIKNYKTKLSQDNFKNIIHKALKFVGALVKIKGITSHSKFP